MGGGAQSSRGNSSRWEEGKGATARWMKQALGAAAPGRAVEASWQQPRLTRTWDNSGFRPLPHIPTQLCTRRGGCSCTKATRGSRDRAHLNHPEITQRVTCRQLKGYWVVRGGLLPRPFKSHQVSEKLPRLATLSSDYKETPAQPPKHQLRSFVGMPHGQTDHTSELGGR